MADQPVRRETAARSDKSIPTLITELRELVVVYAKQETIEPLKGLGRFLAWGLGGALMLGLGGIFGGIAILRALQSETGDTFSGSGSWAPYLLTLLAMVGAGIGAVALMTRRKGI